MGTHHSGNEAIGLTCAIVPVCTCLVPWCTLDVCFCLITSIVGVQYVVIGVLGLLVVASKD